MKTIIISLVSLSLSLSAVCAQSFNNEITQGKTTSLQGKINKEGLSNGDYGIWFQKNYEAYTPSAEITASLKESLKGITIKAFMGTWCGDSKKEVPKFYKLLDEAQFPLDRLTTVGLSRERATYKQSPGGEEEGLHIARVPTFIFYKEGKEINRFVERPIVSLEKDILQLLQGDYQSSYQIVVKTGELLTEMGVLKFQKKIKKLAKKLKPISKHHLELMGYSNVLFFANKTEEAIAVARLNIRLYPEEADAHVSLANKLLKTNYKDEALDYYQNAIDLNPEHKQAKEGLAQLEATIK